MGSEARDGPATATAIARQRVEASMERPPHLANRLRAQRNRRKIEKYDVAIETFTLPLEEARLKARGIIDGVARRGGL